MVALMAAGLGHGIARPTAWGGYGLALAGIAMVAGGGGTGATAAGDLLVLASVALSATFVVVQPRLLAGRDPPPSRRCSSARARSWRCRTPGLRGPAARAGDRRAGGRPRRARLRGHAAPVLALRLRAGARPGRAGRGFLNLEPLVGVAVGWVGFGEAVAPPSSSEASGPRRNRAQHDACPRPLHARAGQARPAPC